MAKKRGGGKKRSAAAAATTDDASTHVSEPAALDEFFVPKGSKAAAAHEEKSAEEGDRVQLRVNEKFASKFQEQKRKEELSRLEKQRRLYGSDGSESESESETEDEDGEQLTRALDADIRKTLQLIRKKDPAIYDSSIAFFKPGDDAADSSDRSDSDDDADEAATKTTKRKKQLKKAKKDAPLYYKDLVRQQVIAGDVDSDDEKANDDARRVMTYGEEQAKLKEDFLATLKRTTDSDDDEEAKNARSDDEDAEELDGGLFTIRKKSEGERKAEDAEYAAFRSKYGTALKASDVDPDAFLEHYLSSEGWKDKRDAIPHYDEIVNGDSDNDDDSADELEKAEAFEHKYNFRFEEEGSGVIQTYARRIEDSMRREDDARKRKRAERKERKALERLKKEEELRRLKNLKQAELESKLAKVARLMGKQHAPETTAAALKLRPSDLEGAFDPDEYDRRMQEVFDEEYYNDMDDAAGLEKPVWDDEEDEALFAGLPGDPDDDDELEAVEDKEDEKDDDEPSASNIIEREAPDDASGSEDENADEVSEAQAKAMTPAELARAKQQYLDELYSLDYEDLIGDLKCRFKYHSVAKNDFGLTVDEIMDADDKELRALVSLKKMAPYVEEEPRVDRKRVKQFKKSLMEARRAREEKRESKALAAAAAAAADAEKSEAVSGGGKKRKRTKKAKAAAADTDAGDADRGDAEVTAADAGGEKKQKKHKTKAADDSADGGGNDTGSTASSANATKKKQRRSKKKTPADAAAKQKSAALKATGLSSSRLESYKLAKVKAASKK
ncbi:hypothetical protein PybrP1_005570 [[Pythium] brassicae (nom. inval.)]|nr:hypothetical protein PybrP1_005570 [[Pythium] brassicae (nom. inval.)]